MGTIRSPHGLFSAACFRHAAFLDQSLNTLQINYTPNGNYSALVALSDVFSNMVSALLEDGRMDINHVNSDAKYLLNPLQVMDNCNNQMDCSINCYHKGLGMS